MNRIGAAGSLLMVTGLLVLGAFAFEYEGSALVARHAQADLLPDFKTAAQTTKLSAPSVTPSEGTPVALLNIPRLGVSQVVVEGSSPADLQSGPGHLSVSPMPGEVGNAVILGRRTTYGGPLHDVDRLRSGDFISATTGQGTFNYVVRAVGTVHTDDVTPLSGTLDNRLTLVTSDPPYLFTSRLVVVAMLEGSPVEVATRNPPTITASDLGMAADPIWLAPAFVLLQLLVGAVWLSFRMRRRYWPASVTYMFAGPTIVALTVATVMIIDRALPGTM